VPSTQMRCIITASRRARATIAFFIPRRCLANLPSNGQATFRRFGRCKSGSVWSRAVKTDLDFLLYPLATEGPPECPACGTPMVIVLHEARENNPDFSRFRCAVCKRSETFICEE
jgi:hypothetical protein